MFQLLCRIPVVGFNLRDTLRLMQDTLEPTPGLRSERSTYVPRVQCL